MLLDWFVRLKCIIFHQDVKFGKTNYPEILSNISVMIGKGYCLKKIAFSRKNKSVTRQTHPSFFGMMNARDVHPDALHGSRVPSSTIWSSFFLKFVSVYKEQDKCKDVLAQLQVWGQCEPFCEDKLNGSSQIFLCQENTLNRSQHWLSERLCWSKETLWMFICSYLASRMHVKKWCRHFQASCCWNQDQLVWSKRSSNY